MIEFDKVAHYQFSFFSPCPTLEPSPQIISKFMQAFSGTDLMPTTVPVFHFGPTPETRQMLHFITANTGWRIEFEPNRVALNKVADTKKPMGTIDEFRRDAIDYCKRILSVLELKGNRLAFVTKGIIPEMSNAKISTIYKKFFNPPKFHQDNEPIEWSSRIASSYYSKTFNTSENFNVITDLNLIKVIEQEKGVQKETPRIEIGFDINTNQRNTDLRFTSNDLEPFLLEAIGLSNQILSDIEIGLL